MQNKKGFTLVELIIVIAILGLLTILVFPAVQRLMVGNEEKLCSYYQETLEEHSKLYIDSMKDDLTAVAGTGCTFLSYDLLQSKFPIKDDKDLDCSETKIRVDRTGDKLKYSLALSCKKKGTTEEICSKYTEEEIKDTITKECVAYEPVQPKPGDDATYEYSLSFNASTTFIPDVSGWFKVYVIGKSGDGGPNNYNEGGGGGGAGGIAVSLLYLEAGESYPIVITNEKTSFGTDLYATAGITPNNRNGGAGGVGYGGNIANETGATGGTGGTGGWRGEESNRYATAGTIGGNGGMSGGLAGSHPSNSYWSGYPGSGGGGGGGARLSNINCPYVSGSFTSLYQAGGGRSYGGDYSDTYYTYSKNEPKPYPQMFTGPGMVLYGGGGGSSGGGVGGQSNATKGTPGLVIIDNVEGYSPYPNTDWTYETSYTSSGTFTPSDTSWYKIYAIGRSGDGGITNGCQAASGGGSGGIAISILKLEGGKSYSFEVTNEKTSFQNLFYATAGGNGGTKTLPTSRSYSLGGAGGVSYLGNYSNEFGYEGGGGGNSGHLDNDGSQYSAGVGRNGLNGGMKGGGTGGSRFIEKCQPAGGGGGSRLPDRYCPYVSPTYTDRFSVGSGQVEWMHMYDSNQWYSDYYSTPKSIGYPAFSAGQTMILYGGGGGQSGLYTKSVDPPISTLGTPGIIIFEKAAK